MWIIDRFESGFAVVECGENVFNVPLDSLPDGVKEGDVICVSVDKEETAKRLENAHSLMNKLFGENR